jgi:hypothetical protein
MTKKKALGVRVFWAVSLTFKERNTGSSNSAEVEGKIIGYCSFISIETSSDALTGIIVSEELVDISSLGSEREPHKYCAVASNITIAPIMVRRLYEGIFL